MNYRKLYKELYSKIDLERVLKDYNFRYRQYSGKSSEEFSGCCPFPSHNDLNPSFSIRKLDGLYNCFVCGGGDFFDFIKNMEKFEDVSQAINFIKAKLGIEDSQTDTFTDVAKPYCEIEESIPDRGEPEWKEMPLPYNCVPAEQYFDFVKKRVSLETIKKWNMLYCIDDQKYGGRLIIPIYFKGLRVSYAARDVLGRSEKWDKMKKEAIKAGFQKDRIIDLEKKHGCKKYLYPFGTQLAYMFFNWDEAIKNKSEVVICEGILDAIRLINYGYNTVSIFSCNMNNYKHEMLIKHFKRVFVALDNDDKIKANGEHINPGQDAAKKIMDKFKDIESFNILLPVGKDPDKCTQQEFENAYRESKLFDKKFTKLFTSD